MQIATAQLASADIQFSRTDNRIWATAPNCYEINAEIPNFRAWLRVTNPEKSCQTQLKPFNGGCSAELTNCLPNHPLQYHDTNPALSGPNCWNLALVMKELVPALRYTTPDEMAFFMRSPLCKEVPTTEPRRPGDIGAIRRVGPDGKEEVHGFIFISDKLAYSKNGFSKESPYALQTVKNVYTTYGVQSSIARCSASKKALNTAIPSNDSKECPVQVQIYRCKSQKAYLNENRGLPEKLSGVLFHADRVDRCASNTAFSGNATSRAEINNLVSSTQVLLEYLRKEQQARRQLDEKTQFLLGSLQVRLGAIAKQLSIASKAGNYTQDINKQPAETLSQLSKKIETELKEVNRLPNASGAN